MVKNSTVKDENRAKSSSNQAKPSFKIQSRENLGLQPPIKDTNLGNVAQMGEINTKHEKFSKLLIKSQSMMRRELHKIFTPQTMYTPKQSRKVALGDLETPLEKNSNMPPTES